MSDAPPESAPKKSKTLLVAVLAVLLLAGGGGGAWWFLGHKAAADGDEEEAHAVAKKKKHDAKPIFTTLEPFTVNLKDPRGERFAQIGVTLQFEDPQVEMLVKDHLPAVRNDILMLISSKQIEDLLSVEGKQQLAQEIRLHAGRAMGLDLPDPEVAPKKAKDDEVADAEDKPKAKGKDADGDEKASEDDDEDKAAARKAAAKRRKRKQKDVPENPIQQVLFSQFIVQ